MFVTTEPLEAYKALIEKGDLTNDLCQMEVMVQLQGLHTMLDQYATQMGKTGWRARLAFRNRRIDRPMGFYIWGGVGRGKSMLMDLFYEHSNVEDRQRVHFHAFMQEVQKRLHAFRESQKVGKVSKKTDPIEALAKLIASKAWLLCFDEFHVTDIGDAMILGRLFEALFKLGVVVICTSNREPKDLYKDGLQRDLFLPFIDMIEKEMQVLQLDHGIDYRFERLRTMDAYLHPLSPETDQKLQQDFHNLTIGTDSKLTNEPQATALQVNGREVILPKTAEGVAFCDFASLCEVAYGPGDYLAIANRFNTMILSKIPKLGPHNRDSAKRFVTLIDSLYEAKVKLVCSAEAPPHELYPSGDGAFEFERTVSRLMEMQTPEYMKLQHKPSF